MKRIVIAMFCFAVLLSACTSQQFDQANQERKYQRISFNQEILGETLASHIQTNTDIINNANAVCPAQIPIYEITESDFTQEEFTQIQENVEGAWFTVPEYTPSGWTMEGNEIHGCFAPNCNFTFTMTEEELEELAWATLRKIPFMDGEYEYSGIRGSATLIESELIVTTSVLVSFYPILDGLRVIGDNQCDLEFNDSGLVQIHIKQYDYQQIGTMDVVPLEDAEARIKTPDAFVIDEGTGKIQTLQVDEVNLRLVNQHTKGCTILQPLYIFAGMATTTEGTQEEFSSRVIAIPESYTYEAQ